MTRRSLALLQGSYDVIGGLWPLLHMRSVEAVTGAKSDRWLVRTTSGLLVAWGAVLLGTLKDDGPSDDLACASAAAASVLATADIWYVARGRIAQTYLLDGIAECALVHGWSRARVASASRQLRPRDVRIQPADARQHAVRQDD